MERDVVFTKESNIKGDQIMKNQIFHSKGLVYSMILAFIILVAYEALPGMDCFGSKEESKPVVRVKKPGKTLTPAQKKRFDELLEESKSLILNWKDYNAAIQRLSEAKKLAVTKEQKSDVYFYLSLAFFKKNAERSSKEFMDAVENLLLVDYFRRLDKDECPLRYIELFNSVKKEYGILRVVSNPQGADVYLNSSKSSAGKTPLTIARKAGKVKVRVKWGRKKKEERVEVIAGQETLTPMFELAKKSKSLLYIIGGAVVVCGIGAAALLLSKGEPEITTGSLQINSDPTGAQVFLDGVDQNKVTNCLLKDIKAGSHTIKLVREDYQDYEETVTVTAGTTTTPETIELVPHVITVTNPRAGQQIQRKPDTEVQIKWEIDTSSQSESHMLSKSLSNFGRNIASQMRRQALIFRTGGHALDIRGEELKSKGPPRNMRIASSGSSKFNEVFVPVNGKMARDISEHMPGSPGPNINGRRRNESNKGNTIALMKMPRAGRLSRIGNPVTNKSFSPTKSRQKAGKLGEIHILHLDYIDIFLIDDQETEKITIATDIAIQGSKGEYTWEVGQNYEAGKYKIRIQSHTEDPDVFGESGLFDIVEAQYTWEFVGPHITDKDTEEETDKIWGRPRPGSGEGDGPYGFTIDHNFHIYVADTGNDRVVKLDIKSNKSGEYVDQWEGVSRPHQIIFNNGFIYVTETDENRKVTRYNTDGVLKQEFDTHPHDTRGVAVGNDGNVYVLTYSGKILKFNSGGTKIDEWSLTLNEPVNLAINSQNIIYVADRKSNNIVYCDSEGKNIHSWSCEGYPLGIAIDSQDHVFVADRDNAYKVFEYNSKGEYLSEMGTFGEFEGAFTRPCAVAFDKEYVYVLDQARDVRKISKFKKVYK